MPRTEERERVNISALQHYSFCPRQCALIYLESAWDDNLFTRRGDRTHERTDEPEASVRDGIRVERALPLFSEELGLKGRADVVEFPDGTPYPVEYKSGSVSERGADEVQLCAQALCLEEMFETEVPEGALYYHGSRSRREVEFTENLRERTRETVREVRGLLEARRMPEPVNDERCPDCSLIDICMPDLPERLAEMVEEEPE